MSDQPNAPSSASGRALPLWVLIGVITVVYACSAYANLSYTVTDKADYRFFPPFQPGVNANMNNHLGAEYFSIARSLRAGQGFANPFHKPSGPTAWMPPVLPMILAGLLWITGGDREAVMALFVLLQVSTLIVTGLLVLALSCRTNRRVGAWVAAVVFVVGLLSNFYLCFQFTHDCWLVLLSVDLLIAGFCWLGPLRGWKAAAGWGLFGGLCALINPIVALAWGLLSVGAGYRRRAWSRLALAVLVAGLTVLPWTVRNYLVFGRWIPVKPNLAYELYQSQCLQPDGLIQLRTFAAHPISATNREGKEYLALGETAYLDHKREQFWRAVRADPLDFVSRVGGRFLGATLRYVPFDRAGEAKRPWALWFSRTTHPLPFLALLFLIVSAARQRLEPVQWIVIGVYGLYLLPYIVVSYYERYAIPLLGVKVLLVIWAADGLLTFRRRAEAPRGQSRAAARAGRRGTAVPSSC